MKLKKRKTFTKYEFNVCIPLSVFNVDLIMAKKKNLLFSLSTRDRMKDKTLKRNLFTFNNDESEEVTVRLHCLQDMGE